MDFEAAFRSVDIHKAATAKQQQLEKEKGRRNWFQRPPKPWLPTVDNLRNFFLTPMTEVLSFLQQLREAP